MRRPRTVTGDERRRRGAPFLQALAPCLLAACILSGGAALAQQYFGSVSATQKTVIDPRDFKEAIGLYNRRQYLEAFQKLDAMPHRGPHHDQVHYYIGLCLQQLNQIAPAKQEFEWVFHNSKDARLRYNSQVAWANLNKYQAGRTYDGQGNNFDRFNKPPKLAKKKRPSSNDILDLASGQGISPPSVIGAPGSGWTITSRGGG